MVEKINDATIKAYSGMMVKASQAKKKLARAERGQGTSEYAILIGVIVIIVVVAVLLFGDKLTQLWNAANNQMDTILGHGFSGQGGSGVTPGGGA